MGEPPTEMIPPVPATPPQGTPITRAELHQRYCNDCPDREACGQGASCEYVRRVNDWFVQHPAPEPQISLVPDKSWVETEGHRSGSAAGLGFVVLVSLLFAVVAGGVAYGTARVVGHMKDQQRVWSTNTELDWMFARTNDKNYAEICRGMRSAEWRTDTIDRTFIWLVDNFPDGPPPNRLVVVEYLDTACKTPWRKP